MQHIAQPPADLAHAAMNSLAPIAHMLIALERLGVDTDRHPSDYGGEWVDHVAWGVDSAVAAIRLLLAGQMIGAAVIARQQLERWTLNRAFNTDKRREPGESTQQYMARVWSEDAAHHFGETTAGPEDTQLEELNLDDFDVNEVTEPAIDHDHVRLRDGREVCPATLVGILSDFIHGREASGALAWDAEDRCDAGRFPHEALAIGSVVCDCITISLRQVRTAIRQLAYERADVATQQLLMGSADGLSVLDADAGEAPLQPRYLPPGSYSPRNLVKPGLAALLPLHPEHGLADDWLNQVLEAERAFEQVAAGRRPAGRLFRDDEMAVLAFTSRRAAAARGALQALDAEREQLGGQFNLDQLSAREVLYLFASETAGVVAHWLPEPAARSAADIVASSLRSAYWLWLEDDDRAMAVLRSTLEQVARMKAWRVNPNRAARMQASPRTTPRDWLDTAGWRRLEALNRALGELSHSRFTSRWHGARELLGSLQLPAENGEAPLQTARGHALDLVTSLVLQELLSASAEVSPAASSGLSELFAQQGLARPDLDRLIEESLAHAWTHKKTTLGEPTFGGPAIDWLRSKER